MNMDVYEKLWASLVQRLLESKKYAIRQPFLPDDVLKVMSGFEEYYKEEIIAYQESKEKLDDNCDE